MRRKLLWLLGVLVAVIAALAFVEMDSPQLGRALLRHAEAATGARIEADGFRLSLLRGLSLRQVRASGTLTGGRYEISLDRLTFEHRWLPLLVGRLSVDRVRLERPHIRVTETAGAAAVRKRPTPAPPVAGGPLPLSLHVSEIAIDDGTVELRAPKQDEVVITGLRVRLRDLSLATSAKGVLAGLASSGEIRVDDVALGTLHVRETQGTFTLDKGRFESRDLRFRTDEGPFEARLGADLGALPFSYSLALQAAPLDLNVISGLAGRGGQFGPADVTLDARGAGSEPDGIEGGGVLKLSAGTFPATPVLAQLEAVLGRTRVVGAAYRATESPYRISDGRVSFERLRLEADTVGLDVGGWTSVDGRIDMRVVVRAPRKQVRIAEVSDDVIDALADDEGWVQIPMRVTGTRMSPRVVPDAGALGAQARRSGIRILEKKARRKLRGLFGGD